MLMQAAEEKKQHDLRDSTNERDLRSIIPVQVSGRSQSSTPLDITTAFRASAPEPELGGPRNTRMSVPGSDLR